MKKLLLAAAAGLLMAACSEAPMAPTSTKGISPTKANADDLTCRSGYVIAYDENGNPYCSQVDGFAAVARPSLGSR